MKDKRSVGGVLSLLLLLLSFLLGGVSSAGTVPAQTRLMSSVPADDDDSATTSTVLDSLYSEAIDALARGQWQRAEGHLLAIKRVHPDYRDVLDRYRLARRMSRLDKLANESSTDGPSNTRVILFWASVTVLGMLPVALVLVFSPEMRARFWVRIGRFDRAITTYERIVRQNPSHLLAYSALADLYLQLGRTDPIAMRAYRKVLELNLPNLHKHEINAIVSSRLIPPSK